MLTLLTFSMSTVALAQSPVTGSEIGEKAIGVGILLGNPTGLSGKFYLGGPRNAVDVALAYGTWGRNAGYLYVHADYLWHPPPPLFIDPTLQVGWHVGVGGFAQTVGFAGEADGEIGVRVPIGIDVDFVPVPIQLFADAALHVGIFPEVWVGPAFTVGARYFF